ncbi:O-antigen ligase family protein [Halomonas litopenaei]|uniref:O-antigen ligase family protein n=1 Tax=Halomonas litopenaei TaxID=2109328 RepID=UPI003FA01210
MSDRIGWEYPVGWGGPRGIRRAGGCLLVLYAALGVLWADVGGDAGSLAALLGLGTLLWCDAPLRRSGALWLLLAAIAAQVLSWGLGYLHHPDWVASNPRIDRLAKLFIFIAVAYWLGGSSRNTFIVWGAALAGFLVASVVLDGPAEWWRGIQGERAGFGIRNGQHGSMLFGVLLLGWIVFGPRITSSGGRLVRWRLGLWIAVLLMCLTAIVIGQTRAVWLALMCSLGVCATLYLVYLKRQSRHLYWRVTPGRLLVFALLVVVVVALLFDVLAQRLAAESHVIAEVLQGNLDDVPYTSVGIRIHSWVAALEWIAERPLVGWGGEARGLVMDHTPWLPTFVKDNFGHLHNFFLEVWVAYGLVGLGVMAALAAWVGRATWKAWRGGAMPNDIALFGATFFVYWVIVNQFESYNSFWTGVYVHNLVVGGLVTHYWAYRHGD